MNELNKLKEKYRLFCEGNNEIPLFLSYSWMDTVYDDWDVYLIEKNNNVLGFMPIVIEVKKSFSLALPQLMHPYLGIFFNYPVGQKQSSRTSFEREVVNELIIKLERLDGFRMNFSPGFEVGLPFQWAGFKQEVRYTNIISKELPLEEVYSNFKESARRQIKKAEKTYSVIKEVDVKELYQLKRSNYELKGEQYPITEAKLTAVSNYISETNNGMILKAADSNNQTASIALFVWDAHSMYYLHGGTTEAEKSSGTMSLLLWKGIRKSRELGIDFNFEGSMIPEIDKFFRTFGGKVAPYYQFSKTNSKLLKVIKPI